jgi:hypothetical protein
MTIERLSFSDGLLIDNPGEISSFLGRTVMEHANDFVTLEPGEYDITPLIWSGKKGSHRLYVFPNGEASSLSHPINSGSRVVRMNEKRVEVTHTSQTQFQDINANTDRFMIAGPKIGKIGIFLYELIYYHR